MEKRIKIIKSINICFLILSIIYVILSFTVFNDDYVLDYLIFNNIYIIGFCIFAIINMFYKDNKKGLMIFLITCFIQIIYMIFADSADSIDLTDRFSLFELSNFLRIIQQIIIIVIIINNIKGKKSIKLSYALVYLSILLNIFFVDYNIGSKYFGIYLQDMILITVNMYISIYILYFNKGFNEKSLRNIIIMISILLAFLFINKLYEILVAIPKRYNDFIRIIKK